MVGMIITFWVGVMVGVMVIALLKASSNYISEDEFLRLKAENKELREARDAAIKRLEESLKLLEENERLKELICCGCGICLAHNNMKCPKLAKVESEGEK